MTHFGKFIDQILSLSNVVVRCNRGVVFSWLMECCRLEIEWVEAPCNNQLMMSTDPSLPTQQWRTYNARRKVASLLPILGKLQNVRSLPHNEGTAGTTQKEPNWNVLKTEDWTWWWDSMKRFRLKIIALLETTPFGYHASAKHSVPPCCYLSINFFSFLDQSTKLTPCHYFYLSYIKLG